MPLVHSTAPSYRACLTSSINFVHTAQGPAAPDADSSNRDDQSRFELDHCPLDIYLIDGNYLVSRPYLLSVVDEWTRKVPTDDESVDQRRSDDFRGAANA